MALSLAPSTALAVVFTTASVLALAAGLGMGFRDRWARQTVAKRGQFLADQLHAQSEKIDISATQLAKSRDDLDTLVREAESTLAAHGDPRPADRPLPSQLIVISIALAEILSIAGSLNDVTRRAKNLPVEVVLYASDVQGALVALIVATDALTSAATELEQIRRELALITANSLPQVAIAERALPRLRTAAGTVEQAHVSIEALRESLRVGREASAPDQGIPQQGEA